MTMQIKPLTMGFVNSCHTNSDTIVRRLVLYNDTK